MQKEIIWKARGGVALLRRKLLEPLVADVTLRTTPANSGRACDADHVRVPLSDADARITFFLVACEPALVGRIRHEGFPDPAEIAAWVRRRLG